MFHCDLAQRPDRLAIDGNLKAPPDVLSIPWGYLAVVAALTVAAVLAAGLITLRALRRPAITELRDL